jgi:hypothetical protein
MNSQFPADSPVDPTRVAQGVLSPESYPNGPVAASVDLPELSATYVDLEARYGGHTARAFRVDFSGVGGQGQLAVRAIAHRRDGHWVRVNMGGGSQWSYCVDIAGHQYDDIYLVMTNTDPAPGHHLAGNYSMYASDRCSRHAQGTITYTYQTKSTESGTTSESHLDENVSVRLAPFVKAEDSNWGSDGSSSASASYTYDSVYDGPDCHTESHSVGQGSGPVDVAMTLEGDGPADIPISFQRPAMVVHNHTTKHCKGQPDQDVSSDTSDPAAESSDFGDACSGTSVVSGDVRTITWSCDLPIQDGTSSTHGTVTMHIEDGPAD